MNHAFRVIALVVFVLLGHPSSLAQQRPPTIQVTVGIEGALRHYEYHTTNTALDHTGGPAVITAIVVQLTGLGLRNIVQHHEPGGWSYTFFDAGGPGWGSLLGWSTAGQLLPGDEVVFDLYTSSNVKVMTSFPNVTSNWRWNNSMEVGPGGSFLPVPAPEPGAWAGLASGLGALAVGRRRAR